ERLRGAADGHPDRSHRRERDLSHCRGADGAPLGHAGLTMEPEGMRILVAEFMDEAAVALLASRFDTRYHATPVDRRPDLLLEVEAADALIVRNRVRVDADLLAAAGGLKVVGRLGVGLDNIDLPGCEARGIEVIPATGANALAVAEYVIAMALVLLRGAYLGTGAVAAGQWPRATLSNGREIAGKTLGVVGFGSIGRTTAKLARGLGMRVIAFDPQLVASASVWAEHEAEPHSLDGVLREADVISLHVPLLR